jgi:hypothetical protein
MWSIFGLSISIVWAALLIFLWIVIALWPASIAQQKGHSFLGYFIVSLFFWWITLFIALFFLNDISDSRDHGSRKE